MEYLAGRLDAEDYHEVKSNYDHILTLENEDRESNSKILALQWQTISDRERRIEELEDRLKQVIRQKKDQVDLKKVEEELKVKFGATWNALVAETRKQLSLALAFAHQPISKEHPIVTPWSLFKAVNSELFGKLFEPHGPLDRGMLGEENGTSPVSLLINYRRRKFEVEKPETHFLISDALRIIGGKDVILTFDDLKCLDSLRRNRNEAEHPKRPYTETAMQKLLRDVWHNDRLPNWLKRINRTA